MKKNEETKMIFGKKIENIGTADSLVDFINYLKKIKIDTNTSTLFFRGETKDYGATALLPQLFRLEGWLNNEHDLLNDYVAKFPEIFPKGTSTFEIMVYADHYGLPVRLLDITSSAFTGLFMACYNYKGQEETSPENDGVVYIFKVKNEEIKNWNSDKVTLLSNIARMESNFLTTGKNESTNLTEKDWWMWMKNLMHTIKDEKPDFYYMYPKTKMSKYKTDFDKIVCVRPKMINTRILNQKGAYFLFGINGKKSDYKNLKFDETVEIFSITISGKQKSNFLTLLANCGCDKMTMFPDMENVCDAIRSKYDRYKSPVTIKYLINELSNNYKTESITFDDSVSYVYYKSYIIVIDKNHNVTVKHNHNGLHNKTELSLQFKIDDNKKNGVVKFKGDNSAKFLSQLDYSKGDIIITFDISKYYKETIASIFKNNSQSQCPKDLRPILTKIIHTYKTIVSKKN